VVVQDETIFGFLTLRFRQADVGLVLDVITIGGIRIQEWSAETLKVLEELARRADAKYLMFETKRAADRFCEKTLGFEKVATIYRRKVI